MTKLLCLCHPQLCLTNLKHPGEVEDHEATLFAHPPSCAAQSSVFITMDITTDSG